MNSRKLQNKMGTIFINLGNNKSSDAHRIYAHLKGKDKYAALSNLSIYFLWKGITKSYKNNKFKILTSKWNERVGIT